MSCLAEDELNSNIGPMACALQSPSPIHAGPSFSELLSSPGQATVNKNQNLSLARPDSRTSSTSQMANNMPTNLNCPRCGGQVRAAYVDAWTKSPVWCDPNPPCFDPSTPSHDLSTRTPSIPHPSQTSTNQSGPLSPGNTSSPFFSDSSGGGTTVTVTPVQTVNDGGGGPDVPSVHVSEDSVIICTLCDAVVTSGQLNPLLPRDDNSPLVPAASYNLNTLPQVEVTATSTNYSPFHSSSSSPALSLSLGDPTAVEEDQRSPSFYCPNTSVSEPDLRDVSQDWKGATLKLDNYLVKIDEEHDYYRQLYRCISSQKENSDDLSPSTVNQSHPPQGQCYTPEELVHLPQDTCTAPEDGFLAPGGHVSRTNSSVRLRTSRFHTSPDMVKRLSSRPGTDTLEALRKPEPPSSRRNSARSHQSSFEDSSSRSSSTKSKHRSRKSSGGEGGRRKSSSRSRHSSERATPRIAHCETCTECCDQGEPCAEHYPDLPAELMHELHDLDHENEDLSADVVYALHSRNFDIKELLGKGISSTVRRVTEKTTGVEYAVKIIDISGEKGEGALVEQTKKDTYREIRILRMCGGHENIIELHDVFETPTFIFLVFEICKKGELFDYLTSVVSLSEKRTRIFMRQLFEAVAFLHEKNIVHRDLKPENILLDDNLNIKVSDFGFATVVEPGEELVELCGTPGYLAPEVLAHSMYENVSGYGREVDMWACGVIMYTLLCGAPPFWNRRQMMMLRAIMNADYTFNSPEWDDISDAPKNLIEKLLVVNPEKRLPADEALKHPFFHSQTQDTKKFNAKKKFRAGVFCVMFYIRLNFYYKHPPPISMDTVRTNPYSIKMMRKIIDGCAFGMYKHWVKRVDNQNRAALFEHVLRDDWKHNLLALDNSSIRA